MNNKHYKLGSRLDCWRERNTKTVKMKTTKRGEREESEVQEEPNTEK